MKRPKEEMLQIRFKYGAATSSTSLVWSREIVAKSSKICSELTPLPSPTPQLTFVRLQAVRQGVASRALARPTFLRIFLIPTVDVNPCELYSLLNIGIFRHCTLLNVFKHRIFLADYTIPSWARNRRSKYFLVIHDSSNLIG
jgi:hypothetical protein